jgi:hypothetical protein
MKMESHPSSLTPPEQLASAPFVDGVNPEDEASFEDFTSPRPPLEKRTPESGRFVPSPRTLAIQVIQNMSDAQTARIDDMSLKNFGEFIRAFAAGVEARANGTWSEFVR